MKNSKLIASVVVFKELHDNNKDIYDIIAEFLKATIILNKKWHFNSTEITSLLESEFDFNLPEAVVKTALKRRLIKSGFLFLNYGEYSVKSIDSKINPEFEANYERKKSIYKETEEQIISHISEREDRIIGEDEIEDIRDTIKNFLLGTFTTDKYSQHISSFIIKNRNNIQVKQRLNDIKEGLVLYTGIRYTADLNELGKWNTELTIFLDTEILFYFAGFSGVIYQEIFNDFFKLVNEINHSSNIKKIKLKYFEETEKEINDFFHVAELIVIGIKTLNPSKTAMKEIINGCSTKSDVVVKRNKLFIDLRTAGILKEDEIDYYKNYKYNIEDRKVVEEAKRIFSEQGKDFDEERCKTYLKIFTKINVLREGVSNRGFDNCKFIMLTGNSLVHFLARNCNVKVNEKDILFATDIDFVTDKFWFKLKKGFGKSEDRPKSFDIITKAQIILSTQINNTVQEKFTALNDKYKKGEITKEEAISLNYELRESSLKPEDITETNLEQNIAFINEFSIEEYIREHAKLKQKAEEGDLAKKELKRRDLFDRNQEIKLIKLKCRILIIAIKAFILLFGLLLFYLGYILIKYLQEPGDTKLSIIGFLIGIFALIPLYKLGKKVLTYLKMKVRKSFKNKISSYFKNPVH